MSYEPDYKAIAESLQEQLGDKWVVSLIDDSPRSYIVINATGYSEENNDMIISYYMEGHYDWKDSWHVHIDHDVVYSRYLTYLSLYGKVWHFLETWCESHPKSIKKDRVNFIAEYLDEELDDSDSVYLDDVNLDDDGQISILCTGYVDNLDIKMKYIFSETQCLLRNVKINGGSIIDADRIDNMVHAAWKEYYRHES